MKTGLCLAGILFIASLKLSAQTEEGTFEKLTQIPNNLFNKIRSNTQNLDDRITKKTIRYLDRLSRREQKLKGKLAKIDSVSANNTFSESVNGYKKLESKLTSSADPKIQNALQEYIPGLDSIQSAFRFLAKTGTSIPGLSTTKLAQINIASAELQQLQSRLQSANEIGLFVKQREQQLKDQLSQFGFSKELAGINKEAFYYQQQLVEYKNILHEPDKLERKILSALSNVPAFQTFMQKNSYLAQLFGIPDNYSDVAMLAGLQTRNQVEQLISNNIGSSANGNINPEQFIMQQMQQAKQAMGLLKDKLNLLGSSGGSADITMPQFKPNNQKTKTFLKRLEYGFNIQTQPSSSFLPTTTSIALLVGYKLKDNFSLGVGSSYLLGLGNGLNHIRLSNQGVGIRSYFDLKAKGNIYISGGLELNYIQQFENLQSISNFDVWQKSALIGFSKQYQISKNKKNNMQLLFDALYKQHIPPSSPIIFRMGYKF